MADGEFDEVLQRVFEADAASERRPGCRDESRQSQPFGGLGFRLLPVADTASNSRRSDDGPGLVLHRGNGEGDGNRDTVLVNADGFVVRDPFAAFQVVEDLRLLALAARNEEE